MARRRALGFLMNTLGLSERRCCRIVGLSRSVQQYQPAPRNDAAVVERLKELASENRRYGYLRLHAMLRREGLVAASQADVPALHGGRPSGSDEEAPRAAEMGSGRRTVRNSVFRLADEHYRAMVRVKRSPKRTANRAFAIAHSRGGILHSFSERFKTRYSSFIAASSVGK